jgi:excisionase family DNA binding protein
MHNEYVNEHDILLTFEEAAALLRVSRATLYRLLRAEQITGHKVGRGWRFYKTDLHGFIAGQRAGTTQPRSGITARSTDPSHIAPRSAS